MKKILTCFVCFCLTLSLSAQPPQKFSYQAVIRNSANALIVNTQVGMRISVLQGSTSGGTVYVETHLPVTNDNGLVSLEIGTGLVVSGTFSGINWANGPYFIRTETDPMGGTNYSIAGSSELMSVPYALFSANGTPGPPGATGPTGPQGPVGPAGPQGAAGTFPNGSQAGEMNYWNGNAWVSVPPGMTGQPLIFCYGIPTWGGCLPQLTTDSASVITANSAITGGNVTADGGTAVTARGVAYGTAPSPNTTGPSTSNGSGMGVFTSQLTGLFASTIYFVRAYATNGVGTAYGNQITFTTSALPFFNCGTSTLVDVDGNQYNTVQIGMQCWIKANLRVSKYRNGDVIPTGLSNSAWQNTTTGAHGNYDTSAANDALYGKLYNWYAVNDSRGLCPLGWHVPSDGEWNRLVKHLDPNADTTCTYCIQSPVAGGALKSTTGWSSPNTGATNSSGFTAISGGCRFNTGIYNTVGNNGYWWSSSISASGSAWHRYIGASSAGVFRISIDPRYGYSVRCIQD